MKKLGQALNKFANGVAWVSFVGVAFLMLLNVADVGLMYLSVGKGGKNRTHQGRL